MRIREGLRRPGTGGEGQDLADGTFCWKCRRSMRRDEKARDREDRQKARARMAGVQ